MRSYTRLKPRNVKPQRGVSRHQIVKLPHRLGREVLQAEVPRERNPQNVRSGAAEDPPL